MKSDPNLSLHSIRHWIFDMDGTLTCAIHDFDQIRETLGLPAGQPILESIEQLDPLEAADVNTRLHELEMEIAGVARAQPGAEALLSQLKESGRDMGILTRNGKDIAQQTLQSCGLEKYFDDEFVISRDCCAPKPHPEGVLMLLNLWSAKASDSAMVGDYLFDLDAGNRAGVWTVHLDTNGDFSWPELTTFGVSTLDQITRKLNS